VFEKEKEALEASRWLIGMTEYAEQGFKHHLGVDSNQTRYILGGVNLSQQLERELATACTGQLRSPDELHFGLIAVDPEFKGYNELKELMQVLEGRGIRCYAHVIGGFPKEPCERTECYGFVDKSKEPEKFLEILSRMSYGWLYPKFEAFGITVLEFYSFGVPMIALGEFGPKSTASNQLGLALEIHESMEEIADRILKHWRSVEYHQCEHRIREIRKQLTWERAVDEILSLLDSPEELIPFRLPR
jgi:glycosyltransferase involved in cell wall biosynthesis